MSRIARAAAQVLSGAASGQILLLLSLPLLTRLLSPEELGYWGRSLAVGMVVAVASTLRLEAAIFSSTSHTRQAAIGSSALGAAIAVCSCLALLTMLVPGAWLAALRVPGTADLLSILVVSFALALFNTLSNLAGARRQYKALAWSKPAKQLIEVGLLGLVGILGAPAWMLPLATAAACVVGAIVLLPGLDWPARRRLASHMRRLRVILRRYRAFLAYDLPAAVLVHARLALPVVLLAEHHGLIAVGLFALAQRLLDAPAGLAASSIGMVYRAELLSRRRPEYLFLAVGAFLLAGGLVLVGAIALTPATLWGQVFGPEWLDVRVMMLALGAYAVARIVSLPLGYTFYVAERVGLNLVLQVAGLLAVIAAFLAGREQTEMVDLVQTYAIGQALFYTLYLLVAWRVVRTLAALTPKSR